MKRIICILVLLCALFTVFPTNIHAASTASNDIIYLDDGSYITISISQQLTKATTKKTKTYTYYDSNGNEEWRADLIGIFSYDGTTATCTSCVCNVTIADTAWSYTQKRCYVNGGSALCDLTMVKKWLGITARTEEMTLSLTCSPTGQLT